jgi:hypothetical protein
MRRLVILARLRLSGPLYSSQCRRVRDQVAHQNVNLEPRGMGRCILYGRRSRSVRKPIALVALKSMHLEQCQTVFAAQ